VTLCSQDERRTLGKDMRGHLFSILAKNMFTLGPFPKACGRFSLKVNSSINLARKISRQHITGVMAWTLLADFNQIHS
jgi:hypothetical protein